MYNTVMQSDAMTDPTIAFRVPEDLRRKALEKCKREDVTLSQVLRRCLREWVKDEPPTEQQEGDKAPKSE
jgi:hypothetical protein